MRHQVCPPRSFMLMQHLAPALHPPMIAQHHPGPRYFSRFGTCTRLMFRVWGSAAQRMPDVWTIQVFCAAFEGIRGGLGAFGFGGGPFRRVPRSRSLSSSKAGCRASSRTAAFCSETTKCVPARRPDSASSTTVYGVLLSSCMLFSAVPQEQRFCTADDRRVLVLGAPFCRC